MFFLAVTVLGIRRTKAGLSSMDSTVIKKLVINLCSIFGRQEIYTELFQFYCFILVLYFIFLFTKSLLCL